MVQTVMTSVEFDERFGPRCSILDSDDMVGSNLALATWLLILIAAYGIRQTPCRLKKVWDERVKEIKRTERVGISRARAGDTGIIAYVRSEGYDQNPGD